MHHGLFVARQLEGEIRVLLQANSGQVAVAENPRIQLIKSLVIETFGDNARHVPQGAVDAQDRAGNGIALNQV